MSSRILNDYTCMDNDETMTNEEDTLHQVLDNEEIKNAPKRKKDVRKAIERYLEKKRLKNAIKDYD